MLCTYDTLVFCSYLLGSLFSNNIVVQVKSCLSLLRNVVHIVLQYEMVVLLFTNNLTLETFFLRNFFPQEMNLARLNEHCQLFYIKNMHVVGYTVLFC